jgi:hypothetical protein
MAGTFEGLSELEGELFAEVFPPRPTKRSRGMPHAPFPQVVPTLLYILMTGCRWCDLPRGPQWAAKSAAHRWLQRWHADGALAAMPSRLLGLAEERGMIHWQYGAVDGSCSPWQRRRGGGRVWPERQRYPHPSPHGRCGHAVVLVHHARQWGRAGPGSPAAGDPARPHGEPGPTAHTSQSARSG